MPFQSFVHRNNMLSWLRKQVFLRLALRDCFNTLFKWYISNVYVLTLHDMNESKSFHNVSIIIVALHDADASENFCCVVLYPGMTLMEERTSWVLWYIFTMSKFSGAVVVRFQGSKLGGAGSRGLLWILQPLPQISAGSPKMYWFLCKTPASAVAFEDSIGLPGKNLDFEPWIL